MSDGVMILPGLLALLAVPILAGTSGDLPTLAGISGSPSELRGYSEIPSEHAGSGLTENIVLRSQDEVTKPENDQIYSDSDVPPSLHTYVAESHYGHTNGTQTIPPNVLKAEKYIIEPGTDLNDSNTTDSVTTSKSSHPDENSSMNPAPVENPWNAQSKRFPEEGCTLVYGSDMYMCGTQTLQIKTKQTTVTCDYTHEEPLNCSNLPPGRSTAGVLQLYVTSCPLNKTTALTCVAGTAPTLVLQDAPTSLSAENVRGLGTEYIYFMAAPGEVHELPIEAMRALPRLEKFRFQQGTDIVLRPDMFPGGALQFLEIGLSGITALPRRAFSSLHNLTTLSLFNNNIADIHPEAFQGLSSLRSLVLESNPLPSLPAGALPPPLRTLHLRRTQLQHLHEGHLTGLHELLTIEVSSSAPSKHPLTLGPRALSNLPALGDVSIDSAAVASLPADLFDNSTAVVNISLQYNSIGSLPSPLWPGLASLQRLQLAHNRIQALAPDTFVLRSLQELDLSGNRLTTLPERAFMGLPSLRRLSLSHNQLSELSFSGAESLRVLSLSHNALHWAPSTLDDYGWESSPLNMLEHLQELDLSYNNISVVYSDWRFVMLNLTKLDLSHNALQELTAADLQFLRFENISTSVDVSYNRITSIQPRPQGAQGEGKDPAHIKLRHNPLHCDCWLFDFITAVQNGSEKFLPDAAVCASPAALRNVSVARVPRGALTCPLRDSSACRCLVRPLYARVECHCPDLNNIPNISDTGLQQMSLQLHSVPTPDEWRRLPALVNRLLLTHLNLTDIPDIHTHVTYIDLTHNHIGTVSKHILERNITLKLAHNDINCECFATDNVKLIQQYSSKFLDYVNMTCSDGTLIHLKDANTICDVYKSALSGTLIAVSLILAACLLALAYVYRIEVQVIMNRHKFCLFLLPKEKDDGDKIYDVFVSFTHEDEKFVINEILPKLTEYLLHVQGRDWEVGGTIPEQIHRSVEQSRRTLVILSEDFLNSRWASEVFRSVHAQATNDKRTRAVILLTDVKRKKLDKDTNTFLSLSTFVKYNDFMFVDKLKYALPRKQCNNRLDNIVCNGHKLDNTVHGGGRGQLWKSNALQVVQNEEGKLVNLAYVQENS